MKTETVIAMVGAAAIALLLRQVHLDALEKQRLRLACERYEWEIQRLSASDSHQEPEDHKRGEFLERSVDVVTSCLKAIPALA